MLIAGGLHSLQQDIERLSSKMQHSISQQPTADEKQHLAAQCDRLIRCYTTLHNSQPKVGGWEWMAEEPSGSTVGNLKQKVAELEAALAAEQRCSTSSGCMCGCRHHSVYTCKRIPQCCVCELSSFLLALPLLCVSVQTFAVRTWSVDALLEVPSCQKYHSVPRA